jgi:hypothetical protein
MISYKQHLFISIIDNISINENYNSNSINLLDLLLEAPIDDKTIDKMIADKKRVSVYYQGDTKSKKGWYSIEPIRVDNKNGSNYLLAYSIPKDGGEPSLQYFSQPKIVNWNVLGNKAVTLSKDYEKKLFKFFRDPKVPKEQKLSYADRLKKVGVNVGNFLKKAAVGAAIVGSTLGGATYGGDLAKQATRDKEYSNVETNYKVSNQVQDQLKYLKDSGKLENEYFTILDDKNSKVYTITPGYKIAKEYKVITGRDKGDELKTKTITDFALDNFDGVMDKFFKSPKDVAKWLDDTYFNLPEWEKRNTPSGVFKRAGSVKNFLNDKIATTFMQKDYGKRYITFETLDGSTIPFGFHGTESEARLKKLNSDDIKSAGLNVSFGCVNFKESDIQEINDFVTSGQISIWLPDDSNGIVKIPDGL